MKKKVLFIQMKGKSFGGVWQVNKIVGESLIKKGYDVTILSLRENQDDIELEHQKELKLHTINKKDIWENTHTGTEIIKDFKKFNLLKAIKKTFTRLKHEISIIKDTKKMHKYINEYDPDYIITSHYQLIDMIPKNYLNKTIHEQHQAFRESINHKGTKKVLDKYKNKIKFLWLTQKTMKDAIKYGIKDSYYIYNAVRFKSKEIAKVVQNKKLITIAQFRPEKRIDLMVDIVAYLLKDKKFNDWTFEIYGSGVEEHKIKEHIGNNKQIKLMGLTNDPKKALLTASINLNTSSYEGFALSILEGNECGVPTITLDFGESVEEEIIDNKTGIIAKDIEDYKNKLKELMHNSEKLKELSLNAKEFSKNFQIEQIIEEWIKLFKELDKQNGQK